MEAASATAPAPTTAPTTATAPATAAPTPATHHHTTYREVLAQPQFRLLFSTRVLGISAETLRITTLSVLIFRASHSPLLSALAFGVGFLPQLPG